MNSKQLFKCFILPLLVAITVSELHAAEQSIPPNFILIFTDDQGYQDVGCFGSLDIRTPHLDQMAAEGMRFTDFYAQTICGPSRAALMTGCYPLRVATVGNRVETHPHLHLQEVTVAEVLKEVGYATACFGKWDLAGHSQGGYNPKLLPTHQGFDYYFGTPTSNDNNVNLIRNGELIEKNVDMALLTERYTDEAIAFIQRSKDRPFFVYLAHTMPHVRLAASDPFEGESPRGLYGDVVEEIDANIGRILNLLKDEGLDENTYVFFMSDNGPWYLGRSGKHIKEYGEMVESYGGSAAPLRGAKTSTWEGGLRVPCIMRAPGRIPVGTVCTEIASTMDMLPTLAMLAGGHVPADRVIDGHDIRGLIHGAEGAEIPDKAFFYYQKTTLCAVRVGRWKLQLSHPPSSWTRYLKEEDVLSSDEPRLYDLLTDLGETTNVVAEYPEIVAELLNHAEWARKDIGDHDVEGGNARFFDPERHRSDLIEKKGIRVE
ncbi:MAG: sulfatase [Pontiella sp.]